MRLWFFCVLSVGAVEVLAVTFERKRLQKERMSLWFIDLSRCSSVYLRVTFSIHICTFVLHGDTQNSVSLQFYDLFTLTAIRRVKCARELKIVRCFCLVNYYLLLSASISHSSHSREIIKCRTEDRHSNIQIVQCNGRWIHERTIILKKKKCICTFRIDLVCQSSNSIASRKYTRTLFPSQKSLKR